MVTYYLAREQLTLVRSNRLLLLLLSWLDFTYLLTKRTKAALLLSYSLTMRFSTTTCVAALSATVVSAGSWFGSGSQDVIVNDANRVPGDSPLEFCDSDHSKDIVHIEQVDLLPNPPEAYVSFSPSSSSSLVQSSLVWSSLV